MPKHGTLQIKTTAKVMDLKFLEVLRGKQEGTELEIKSLVKLKSKI
jgi:hypothetical protein